LEVIVDYYLNSERKQALYVIEHHSPPRVLKSNVHCSSYNWKARSRLPIRHNWTFFARCYGWGATSEYRFESRRFCTNGVSLAQNSMYKGVVLHQPFFVLEN